MLKDTSQAINELVDYKVSSRLSSLYTGFPATIVSYDNQLAEVKPVMDIRFPDGDIVELGSIRNVPVIFPSAGGGILSFPVKEGDPVWVQCSTMSFDTWKATYSTRATAKTRRKHSINDAVCFPCVYPKNIRLGVSSDNIELVFHNIDPSDEKRQSQEIISSFKLKPDGEVELVTKDGHAWKCLPDKSFVLENTETGAKIHALSDGNLEITTANTVKIQNSSEELVNLCSELMQLLIDTTTNTSIGPMPLNNKAQISALKSRLDTLKG